MTQKIEATPRQSEFARDWPTLLAGSMGCAFCMATVAAVSMGSFVKPLEESMGWSRTEIQGALFVAGGLGALGIVITGTLLERYSAKVIASVALIGNALAFALASQAYSLSTLYICYGLGAFIGAGASFITWSRAITQTFDKNRGLALAIALSGTGVASIFIPRILVSVISSYGWQAGFWALAALQALLALPAILLCMKSETSDQGHKAVGPKVEPERISWSEVLSERSFWLILVSVFCVYSGVAGMLPNFIPALTDSGMSAEAAATAQGAVGIGLLVGRLTLGWLVDRFWAPAVGAIYMIPATVGSIILSFDPSPAMAAVSIAFFGVASGAELDLLAFLISRYFRSAAFSRAYAILYIPLAMAGAIAPVVLSYIAQLTGGYDASLYICVALFPIGGGVLLALGPYPKNFPDVPSRAASRKLTRKLRDRAEQ